MNYVLPIATVCFVIASFYVFLRDLDKNPLGENGKIFTKSVIAYSVIMVALVIAITVMFCTMYASNGTLYSLKRLALISLMWPIAYIDFKSYRIPNSFIILGLVFRVIIFAFELVFETENIKWIIITELIATAALLLASFLCSVCIKNSIGFGDMKLFIVMGLMLGLDGIWSAIFLSLIVSFVLSLGLLVTKKKTRKDAIPFAPAMVIGTFISVGLTGR